MSLVEHYEAPIYPQEEPYTDERGHVTHPLEIPKMDPALCEALQSVDLVAPEAEVGPCEHAIERAHAILLLASDTADPKKRDFYLRRAQTEINIARENIGYGIPLDKESYELAA